LIEVREACGVGGAIENKAQVSTSRHDGRLEVQQAMKGILGRCDAEELLLQQVATSLALLR